MRILHLPFPTGLCWEHAAIQIIANEIGLFEPIAHKVSIEIYFGRPDARKRDLQELSKKIINVLLMCGVLESEHFAEDLHVAWSDKVAGVQVSIKNLDSKQVVYPNE